MHNKWYYDHFDTLFATTKDYKYEIDIINSYCEFKGSFVEEVGAGTGHHAEHILKYNPQELWLIDNNKYAIDILEKKFSMYDNVKIGMHDGFSLKSVNFDTVICMYSVVQQVKDYQEFVNRINSLLKKIKEKGWVAFEMIDREVSENIYPDNFITEAKINGNCLSIKSNYSDSFFEINIKGTVCGEFINFTAKLISITAKSLLTIIKRTQCSDVFVVPLTKNRRRNLVLIKK